MPQSLACARPPARRNSIGWRPLTDRERALLEDPVGGLIIFTTDGYLSCLEIYSAGDPLLLPNVDQIRPYVISDQ